MLAKAIAPSFFVLRISTLFFSCCTVVLLWRILLRIGCRRELAGTMLLAWAFNPLQFSLSFTYLTEIPFIFLVALALYFYVLHLDSGRYVPAVLGAATLGYAFLIRRRRALFHPGAPLQRAA